jgi:uncharacterized protein (DUF58 family)
MLPTRRLFLNLLAIAPLGVVGGAGRVAVVGLTAAILLVALVDWWLARDYVKVTATRDVADKLSLADWNEVTLSVANGTGRTVRVAVRDVVPPDFQVEWQAPYGDGAAAAPGPPPVQPPSGGFATLAGGFIPRWRWLLRWRWLRRRWRREPDAGHVHRSQPAMADLVIPPSATGATGGTGTVEYRVRPQHRGDFRFGDLYVRVDGPLRLVRRQRRVAGTAAAVRVYPSLKQLRRYELLVRRGLMAEAGAKAIRVPGASTEFARLREYVPDDEFRRINWKATARRGKPIVNEFEAERSQNVVLMIDAGRLMGARAAAPARGSPAEDEAGALVEGETVTGLTKLDYALNSALLLAYVASARGDRVALLAYTDQVRAFVPPARGRRAFLAMVDALYNLAPEAVEPDHGLAFQFLARRNLRRSLVVLFTDLGDREASAALLAHVLRAARQHLVVSVTLGDPTVVRPAAARPDGAQALYEKMVAQRLLDERAATLATLAQRGVHTLDTDADKLSPSLIDAYLEIKQRGRI